MASQIRPPRCHPRRTLSSYHLTRSFPARAILGCYCESRNWVPRAWEGVLPGSYPEREAGSGFPWGALHHPGARAPPGASSSQSSVGGTDWRQQAGVSPLTLSAALIWKVGAGVGTLGSRGDSAARSRAGCGTVSSVSPRVLRSGGEPGASGPPPVSSLLPSLNGGGVGWGDRSSHSPLAGGALSCVQHAAVPPAPHSG